MELTQTEWQGLIRDLLERHYQDQVTWERGGPANWPMSKGLRRGISEARMAIESIAAGRERSVVINEAISSIRNRYWCFARLPGEDEGAWECSVLSSVLEDLEELLAGDTSTAPGSDQGSG